VNVACFLGLEGMDSLEGVRSLVRMGVIVTKTFQENES
jgi:hypothetical protein